MSTQPNSSEEASAESLATPKVWAPMTRLVALIILLVLGFALLLRVREILGPVAIAAFIAYLLHPFARVLQRRIIRSWGWSVLITYVVFLLLVSGGIALAGPNIVSQLNVVAGELQGLTELAADIPEIKIGNFTFSTYTFNERVTNLNSSFADPAQAFRVLRGISTNVGWVVLTLFCIYYFLKDGHEVIPRAVALMPPDAQADIERLLYQIAAVWHAYLRGQLLLMLFVGTLTGIGAATLGIGSALAIGIVTAVLDIIPSIGPFIAWLIAMLVAGLEGSALYDIPTSGLLFLVFLLFGMIQFLENVWLRPRIMANQLNLHPAIVFVSIVASLTISGVLLTLFIVPLLSSALLALRYVRCRIYGIDPWQDAPIQPQKPVQTP